MQFWLGVASKAHVISGVKGGFCQLNHGKIAPLRRMHKGDWIIYYSPKEDLQSENKLQLFTAIGQIRDDKIVQASTSEMFNPYRRNVDYFKQAKFVPLEEISSPPLWKEYLFRLHFGHFEISKELFEYIAKKMGLDKQTFSTIITN